jgi:hypothetical protein
MKHRFKVGSKYTIQFHDHCTGDFKVLCEVTMWITDIDDTHVYGTWWKLITDDEEVEVANREMVSIIKSTITKKRKLELL